MQIEVLEMRRTVKTIATLCAAVVLCMLLGGHTAHAAAFDAGYYANRYPDVVAVLGTDPAVLQKHYQEYGFGEGRYQNAEEEAAGVPAKELFQPLDGYSTYVDVSIDDQTMTCFIDGHAVLHCDCVTGDVTKQQGTPRGVYSVLVRLEYTYLIGPTWKSWVDRWMKFTESGCGLHDAQWRSRFGGEIYKGDGSHGCVNLPHGVALRLYDMVDVGTVVVVH